ncbi:MAG TPA: NAD(P)-dependent oxidoreductase [Anaeromyxobacteraceae bacterium]|nr:NAD(P)-dependent oxidoreductase [Anaeromyxobacteraceae bacterium]
MILVGGSGFLGRHLIQALRGRYQIWVLARRTEQGVGMERTPDVHWIQVDIAERAPLAAAFAEIGTPPRPCHLVHLAAHYDFTGRPHREYRRTNIDGLRNVLELAKALRPDRFYFASSVAACAFPPPGEVLDESSPPDGDHIYAWTKRVGEAMVREYEPFFPSAIVRMAALFSDWCEYPPLYFFLRTWLSSAWNRRFLGGRGESAIPYLHVRCAASFYARLLEVHERLRPGEVLIASTDGCESHRATFEAATAARFGQALSPIATPRWAARFGLWLFEELGKWRAEAPFERAWMGKYIDQRLAVDARRTRERIDWAPNPRLFVLRRIPFMVENQRTNPLEWRARNLAALDSLRVEPNLALYHLLCEHDEEILQASMAHFLDPDAAPVLRRYLELGSDELRWAKRQLFLALRNAVRTADKSVFRSYCREIAARRFRQGFSCEEVCRAFADERDLVLKVLRRDPRAAPFLAEINTHVAGTFITGIDDLEDVFELLSGVARAEAAPVSAEPGPPEGTRAGGAKGRKAP